MKKLLAAVALVFSSAAFAQELIPHLDFGDANQTDAQKQAAIQVIQANQTILNKVASTGASEFSVSATMQNNKYRVTANSGCTFFVEVVYGTPSQISMLKVSTTACK